MMTGRTRNSFPYYTDFRRMVDCQFSCLSRRPLDLIEKRLYSILDDIIFNSHAVDIAVAWSYGFEIDFVRNLSPESAAGFFIIILKLIFTPIFEIKNHQESLDTKKFWFSWAECHWSTYISRYYIIIKIESQLLMSTVGLVVKC